MAYEPNGLAGTIRPGQVLTVCPLRKVLEVERSASFADTTWVTVGTYRQGQLVDLSTVTAEALLGLPTSMPLDRDYAGLPLSLALMQAVEAAGGIAAASQLIMQHGGIDCLADYMPESDPRQDRHPLADLARNRAEYGSKPRTVPAGKRKDPIAA